MKKPHTGDSESRRIRQRQVFLFSVLASVLLAGFALWLAGSGGKSPAPAPRIDAELAGPGTAEESWTRKSESRLGLMEARLRELETEGRKLADENRRLQDTLEKNAEDARRTIDRQAAIIEDLFQTSGSGPFEAPGVGISGAGGDGKGFFPGSGAAGGAMPTGDDSPGIEFKPRPLIEKFNLDRPGGMEEATPEDKTAEGFGYAAPEALKRWLPAGSHARAVVLAGVDASAGISSQGDPRPILLRITGPAWTAAEDGTAMSVDIEGCTVTGAAHGDLSSEKVYARLQTMTCSGDEPGTVVETEVAGFVANTGKAGVRGPVVSREGALVGKAFLAGVFSGVGQGISSAYSPQAVATGGGSAAVANTGFEEIGRAGIGAGAATAGGKVADYLIRRAEQYQPVIQLRAGTPVSVVFIEGARLGSFKRRTAG
ncbi:MAG: TraB/VirB10 family protein [Gammaproteobacteria bacterium]|nr:TraB/VirB10 family protein [Gammaproteobacteria bacterium]